LPSFFFIFKFFFSTLFASGTKNIENNEFVQRDGDLKLAGISDGIGGKFEIQQPRGNQSCQLKIS
jgi:hypothetical protein